MTVEISNMKILDFYLTHGTDEGVWDKICKHRCKLQKYLSGMQEILETYENIKG